MKQFFLLCSLLFLLSGRVSGQSARSTPLTLGILEKIQSQELGETRTLNIFLPEGYSADSSETYPVIYLLDGSANEDFIHIAGIVQFLTMIEAMPESIVVGIANVDRRRDFTFPTGVAADKKDYPTTGGSRKFMAFIEKELQPFIQHNFKTADSKTIIGQSLGGLFAAEALTKKPRLFDHYIIVSPSLWWDKESLLSVAPTVPEKPLSAETRVYISVGSEEKQMVDDARNFASIVQTWRRKNLRVDFVPLPKEDHLTILHNSVYQALVMLNAKKSGKKM